MIKKPLKLKFWQPFRQNKKHKKPNAGAVGARNIVAGFFICLAVMRISECMNHKVIIPLCK